jgi:hypothetical protein
MRTLTLVVTATLALCSSQARADSTIPYPNSGTVAPTNVFTATASGEVDGYFVGKGSAGALDYLQMIDVTTNTSSGLLFDNQTSTPGQEASFGNVTAGDLLEFQIFDASEVASGYPNGLVFSSNPANDYDGVNHAYAATWVLGNPIDPSIPSGVYIGMEDLPAAPFTSSPYGSSDLNYQDDQAVFTDVTVTPTPEPGNLYLLGIGLLSLAGVARRKLRA